jgi:hypothetical protein
MASPTPQFTDADPEETFALFERIGFTPPAHADDGALAGSVFAARAEIQMATLKPGQPLGVTGVISDEAKAFFAQLAEHRGGLQVITDASGTYVFEAGQPMEHIPPATSAAASTPAQTAAPQTAPAAKKPRWKFW